MKYQKYFNVNQALWDQKVDAHKTSEFYDLEGFKKGNTSLKEIELDEIGHLVKNKSMLHLMCHFGQDSLSWARMGAQVTGVDLSSKAIELARELNQELGLNARFICSNVYDTRQHLEEQFDIVFSSYGVLAWLSDLDAWAKVVADSLKPGGFFYIAEFHPVLYLFDFDSLRIEYAYFNQGEPYEEIIEGTYAAPDATLTHKEYFWQHSFDEILSALLNQGLQLESFREYPFSPYNCFPNLEEVEPGRYHIKGFPVKLPHVFGLKMRV